MPQELKIRIRDRAAVERLLKAAGAVPTQELQVTYTYFNQPEGQVLKLAVTAKETWLVAIAHEETTFKIVKNERVENPEEMRAKLTATFGVKAVLHNNRTFFDWRGFRVSINEIKERGTFLILEGQGPTVKLLEELGIEHPELITVSFDRL